MIVSLQYLRAAAAILVVAYHACDLIARSKGAPNGFTMGQAGVDIFFVISGFIMWVTTAASPAPGAFALKRVMRIVPLYWLLTLFVAAAALAAPALLPTAAFDLRHFIASLLFIPAAHPATQEMTPLLIPGWTLNYEMAFYALFALCLALPRAMQSGALIGALGFASLIGLMVPENTVIGFYTNSIILEFAAGALLGALWLKGWRLPVAGAAAAVALGFGALWQAAGADLPRIVGFGAPAALIVAGVVSLEPALKQSPARLAWFFGNASYSLYLTHGLALAALFAFWQAFMPDYLMTAQPGLFLAAAIFVSLVAGAIVYLTLEKPMMDWMTRRSSGSAPELSFDTERRMRNATAPRMMSGTR